tara:strand:+ start:1674 stop:2171 length:498 start_codon:yes stop_codon:yes gene_type:complete
MLFKNKKLVVILFSVFSFIFSDEILKDVILYDTFDPNKSYPIKLINYYSKTNDGYVIFKSEHYSKSGELIKTDNYSNGLLNGKIFEYSKDGKIKKEMMYKEGILHGKWIEYENGKIHREGNMENGKREGTWTDYYPNGQIKYQRIYKNEKVIEKIILPDSKREKL